MKKKLLKLSIFSTLLLVTFIIIFVVINLFDAPEPADIFTLKDLAPASLENSNGYIQLMTFTYPSDKDIFSTDVSSIIKKFSTVDVLSLSTTDAQKIQKKHSELSQKLKMKWMDADTENIFKQNNYSDFERIVSHKERINTLINSNQVLMKRYMQLLLNNKVEDFSLPSIVYPIPRYMSILKTAKLYIAQNIIDAVDGKWQESVANIFKQINFFRKLSKNSRYMMNKMVSQLIMRTSLRSLSFIMNQETCPAEVFPIILDGLPLLEESEISVKKSIIFEFLSGVQLIDEILRSKASPFGEMSVLSGFFPSTSDWLNFLAKFKIFLNRNRTIQFYLNEIKKILEFENKPPFLWKQDIMALIPPNPTKGFFWWISNPIGKALYSMSYSGYKKTIYDKYKTQVIFDLTRLCAEYHLKFTPDKQVSELIKQLDNYKTIDPFSGKSYIFNEEKNIFYSVGKNRIDDGGIKAKDKSKKYLDFVLSCRFNRKTENK